MTTVGTDWPEQVFPAAVAAEAAALWERLPGPSSEIKGKLFIPPIFQSYQYLPVAEPNRKPVGKGVWEM